MPKDLVVWGGRKTKPTLLIYNNQCIFPLLKLIRMQNIPKCLTLQTAIHNDLFSMIGFTATWISRTHYFLFSEFWMSRESWKACKAREYMNIKIGQNRATLPWPSFAIFISSFGWRAKSLPSVRARLKKQNTSNDCLEDRCVTGNTFAFLDKNRYILISCWSWSLVVGRFLVQFWNEVQFVHTACPL